MVTAFDIIACLLEGEGAVRLKQQVETVIGHAECGLRL